MPIIYIGLYLAYWVVAIDLVIRYVIHFRYSHTVDILTVFHYTQPLLANVS